MYYSNIRAWCVQEVKGPFNEHKYGINTNSRGLLEDCNSSNSDVPELSARRYVNFPAETSVLLMRGSFKLLRPFDDKSEVGMRSLEENISYDCNTFMLNSLARPDQ